MTDSLPPYATSLHRFASGVQQFAGLLCVSRSPRDLLLHFRTLLDTAPMSNRTEQLVSERLVSDALVRLRGALGIHTTPAPYYRFASAQEELARLMRPRRAVSG